MSTSANAVVGWCLVPVIGYVKLYGFLLELARVLGLREDVVRVGRWWGVLAIHIILRGIVATILIPGWGHIADSLLAIAASILGIRLVRTFQQAYVERSRRGVVSPAT